ncbi:hypothetical protein OIV83_000247 [Microbotryomycetes sp. JL201]|nr:hypothetical protein OIV83_000247 [Microbotryomycetes sp. JL201]
MLRLVVLLVVSALCASLAISSPVGPARLPSPGHRVRVPLQRRSPSAHAPTTSHATLPVANLDNLKVAMSSVTNKYTGGAFRYHSRTGHCLPGFQQLQTLTEQAQGAVNDWAQALGLKWPSGSNNRNQRRQQAPLRNHDEVLWAGEVEVGTPGQAFSVIFDTGSADLWIPGANARNGHQAFHPNASSTVVNSTLDQFNISYADGSSVAGPVYTDRVTVANLTAEQQHFAAADTVAASISDDPQDGVLGMAYSIISNMGERPFFQTLFMQQSVKDNVFAFRLGDRDEGELYLGGVNHDLYEGSIEYTDVTVPAYWMVQGATHLTVPETNNTSNSTSTTFTTNKDQIFVIDTGTSLILAPTIEAERFYAQVPSAKPFRNGYYQVWCNQTWTAEFSFGSSSRTFAVDSKYMNLGLTETGSEWCVPALAAQDVKIGAWVLGDAFIRNTYAIFEMGAARIGFASPKKAAQT